MARLHARSPCRASVGPYVGHRLADIGVRCVLCRVDGGRDDRVGPRIDVLDGIRGDAERLEPGARDIDRVMLEPALEFLGGAVLRRVGARVSIVAVRLGLDDRRAIPRPSARRGGGDGVTDDHDVVAVDDLCRDPVGRSPVGGGVVGGGDGCDRRVLHVKVVLAHEEDRQLPDRGHVERLVERADVGGAIAEEGHGDLIGAAQLSRPRGADGHRQVGADDRIRAEHVALRVGQVHRAALGLAEPGCLLHEFGQTRLWWRAPGHRVMVTAVGREDIVLRLQPRASADRDRLLAGRQVCRALYQAGKKHVVGGFLGASDHRHLFVHAKQLGRAGELASRANGYRVTHRDLPTC